MLNITNLNLTNLTRMLTEAMITADDIIHMLTSNYGTSECSIVDSAPLSVWTLACVIIVLANGS